MKIWSVILGVMVIFVSIGSAANLVVDYESRTSDDKTNLFYRTYDFEVYVLKTNNLEIEAGPRFNLGPVRLTTRLGGVWNLADSTVYPFMATNLFMKYGRLTALGVFEYDLHRFSLKQPKAITWTYQEGFVMVDLDELLSQSSIGINYEHFRKDQKSTWVVGPRFNYEVNKGYLESISLWAGVTENPTAGIFFKFKL